MLVQNQDNIADEAINIKASESLVLAGTSSDGKISSAIRSEVVSSGTGANIILSTDRIVLKDGGRIGSTTYKNENGRSGDGGSLSINSNDSVQLLGSNGLDSNRQSFLSSSIASTTYGDGDAGSLYLSTSQLKVTSGGSVTSTTLGIGDGGNVDINSDTVEVTGIEPRRNAFSAISSASVNTGNAGNLTITTEQLKVADGATVSTSSFANGNAGNLIINSSELVELNGGQNTSSSTIRSAAVPLSSETARRRLGVPDVPTGNAGNLIINTSTLNVTQEGVVSVQNEGTGSAGTLSINAENLNLDESANITAAAESGIGGNLELNTQNLNISKDSKISTTANGNENGGNITINTQNLNAKKTIVVKLTRLELVGIGVLSFC